MPKDQIQTEPPAHISADAGTIRATDIEELNAAVWPWDLNMTQLGRGQFNANLGFVQFRGMLLSHERWSKRLSAVGSPPYGYLALSGSCSRPYVLCGQKIDSTAVVCERGGASIEFVTPDNEAHWVLLVPNEQIMARLGEELAEDVLSRARTHSADPVLIGNLGSLVSRIVERFLDDPSLCTDAKLVAALQTHLLDAVFDLVLHKDCCSDPGTVPRRRDAARHAARIVETLHEPIGVDELASLVGASRRSLEMGFREYFDVSPRKYTHLARLNGLHHELRSAVPGSLSVTDAATRWGFFELGRASVDYRMVFGECPSATLSRDTPQDTTSFADVLAL